MGFFRWKYQVLCWDLSAMSVCLLKVRLIAGFILATLLILSNASNAQEPSPRLKQADADYRAGVAALSRNDLNTAREDFEKVVGLAPSAEPGHSALGAVLLRLGHTAEGIRELEKALAIQASDSSAQLNLALAFEQSGQPAKALPWFAKVDAASRTEKRPLPAEVLAAYARSLAAARQFAPSLARMKEAVAEAPQNAELHDELGSLYALQKDWTNAQNAFAGALKVNPGFAMAHLHLAMTLQAEQQPGVLEELAAAYQLAPDNPVIALEFGRALAAGGSDERAIPMLRHAVELDPSSTAAAYQLGLALQRTNQAADAIPLFQKAATAEANNAEILTNLGMALCQVQRAKEAVPVLQRALSLTPDNPTAHQNLAAAYIQLSQLDDAVNELRAALKLSPGAASLHYNLGLAFKMQDDAADAISELEAAEKLDPSAPESSYALGLLYLQAGRYADAARELNISLKLRPENGDGWATLGSVYNNLDKLPEAADALHEAIRQRPEQPDPYLTLAAVLAKENQPTEATAERRKAADLMRANMNRQRAEVASNSGKSLLKGGKLEDAIVEFRNALSYDPDYAEAHRGLASALQQQGKTIEASAERQKAEVLESKSRQPEQR
jgi:protein O-GlcNAc transferase